MAAKHTLSEALKTIRKARGLSQEAFSDVSSRTYMSTLERDLKSPTLNKLAELCEVMEVHPLTLLTLAYAGDDLQQVDQLLVQVRQELETVAKKSDTPWRATSLAWPIRRCRFGDCRGAKHRAAGIGRRAFPGGKRSAAPQARRREGLEPDGRDGEVGTGRSP